MVISFFLDIEIQCMICFILSWVLWDLNKTLYSIAEPCSCSYQFNCYFFRKCERLRVAGVPLCWALPLLTLHLNSRTGPGQKSFLQLKHRSGQATFLATWCSYNSMKMRYSVLPKLNVADWLKMLSKPFWLWCGITFTSQLKTCIIAFQQIGLG